MTAKNERALIIALGAIFVLGWFGKGGYRAAIALCVILAIVFALKGLKV